MNSRLVDSLIDLIESLDREEYILLQQRLSERIIQKHPDICSGYARIRNTRKFMIQLLREKGYDLLTSQEAGQAKKSNQSRKSLNSDQIRDVNRKLGREVLLIQRSLERSGMMGNYHVPF